MRQVRDDDDIGLRLTNFVLIESFDVIQRDGADRGGGSHIRIREGVVTAINEETARIICKRASVLFFLGYGLQELAARMALQLERLEAIRAAAAKLMSRHQLGRDVFARGAPEGVTVVRQSTWTTSLYDLIRAYADWAARKTGGHLTVKLPAIFTMEEAIHRLSAMLGVDLDWTQLEIFMPEDFTDPLGRRSALAGTFAASLELVRQGKIQLRQSEAFAPIFIRKARDE